MSDEIEIFPKALITAARTFAKRPAIVGEVLCALCVADGTATTKLSEVQRYIVAACREEMAERRAQRAAMRERMAASKRRQRARVATPAQSENRKGGK